MTKEPLFHRIAVLALVLPNVAGLACQPSVAELTDAGGSVSSTGAIGLLTTSGTTSGSGATGRGSGGSAGSAGSAGTGGTAGVGGATSGSGSSGGIGAAAGTGGGTTTGGVDGGLLGQACIIDQGMDPCVAVGLVCLASTSSGVMGLVCQVPGEFSPCQSDVGCNDIALTCLHFSTGSYCLRSCQSAGDCPILYTTCQGMGVAQVCYFDFCNLNGDGGVFSTCDAADAGDGTCIPGAGGGGVCLQGGSRVAGDVCSDHRASGNTPADFCETDAACISGGVNGAGHCAPLCGLDAGPLCPSPTFCEPSGSGDWGYCL